MVVKLPFLELHSRIRLLLLYMRCGGIDSGNFILKDRIGDDAILF